MRRANCAGTRNGYVSGGAPVGEDFPRTRIREEKARYGGGLERSGASRRNRWRRAPWILRRRLWFHLATGWPGRALFLEVVRPPAAHPRCLAVRPSCFAAHPVRALTRATNGTRAPLDLATRRAPHATRLIRSDSRTLHK